MNHPNQPAFPTHLENGLTKREYFAALVMQGICAAEADNEEPMIYKRVAAASVLMADALISELNKNTSTST